MIGGAPNKRHCLRAKRWLFEPKKRPLRKTMPRANRHFLPGHVWHITHRVTKKFVQNVPIVQPLRSVQAVEEGEPRELPLLSDRVIGAVICTGFSKQRSGSVYRCSIMRSRPTTFIF